jgi:single-strand DNA-binding protein
MAASLNKVFIMGNLTRDPELRYVPSGTAVANFTVAVNRVYKDKTGAKKEEVSFIRVVVWGKMAEVCGEYLTKGRPVLVEGRLQSRSWEAQDGQKRSALDVIADSVQFIGPRSVKSEGEGEAVRMPEQESVASVDLEAERGDSGASPAGAAGAGDEEIPF